MEGVKYFVAWEGTGELRSEPRVSSLRRFSRKADELFLKVRSETEWSESPVCEERGHIWEIYACAFVDSNGCGCL